LLSSHPAARATDEEDEWTIPGLVPAMPSNHRMEGSHRLPYRRQNEHDEDDPLRHH